MGLGQLDDASLARVELRRGDDADDELREGEDEADGAAEAPPTEWPRAPAAMTSPWPGRMATASLMGSWYTSRRAASTRTLEGWTTVGTSLRTYMAHATRTPTMTRASVRPMTTPAGRTGSPCSAWPVTGSSQVTKALLMLRTPPRPIEKTDRTMSGIVMSGPDSCGCTGPSTSRSVVQRALPWKIMKKRRDM